MLKKIYEVDPLICPKCGGQMRIIASIEDYKIVKKILDYLGIYEFKRDRPPPRHWLQQILLMTMPVMII
ncbi:MAG: hypothetical protein L6305_01555 [Actinomycetia bacterium]|nr:hypothetical protein [Actinomycetes bacterium]